MSSFKLPDVAFDADDAARIQKAIGDTLVFWVKNIRRDPLSVMEQGGLSGKPLVVTDDACAEALGTDWKDTAVFRIPGSADATETLLDRIRGESRNADYLLAVGTGTISDLCKYAAQMEGKRYGIIPTAPTMNGFTSGNASIRAGGIKKTFQARQPKVVACDLDLLSGTPRHMRAAGFGDAMSRFTAQTDWYMAHLMVERPYDPLPYRLLAPLDKQLALSSGALGRGSPEAVKILMENLLISGFGMVVAGSSAPASQGEHLIAHTLELSPAIGRTRTSKVLHGEQIAITTLTMSLLQRIWLESPSERWKNGDWKKRAREKYWNNASIIAGYFGIDTAPGVYKEYQKKLPNDRGFEQLLGRFDAQWDGIRSRVMSQVPRWSSRQLHQMLQDVGAPTELGQVGWYKSRFDSSLRHAHFIRDRWTFLDMAFFFGPNRY